ncbi:MAG: hypothetical protein E7011_01845 [Alphaproteobacteria bacterium]|nr:hypothetical protein [Alphaproteobacteria bacterium]
MAPRTVKTAKKDATVVRKRTRTVKPKVEEGVQETTEAQETPVWVSLLMWGVIGLCFAVYYFWGDIGSAFVGLGQWFCSWGLTGWTNVVFIGGMLGLLGWDLKKHTYSKAWYPTLGMLGTFVGILLGLLDFNVKNPGESLPTLLGGLTTAFLTSIVGVGLSGIRAFVARWPWGRIEEKSEVDYLETMNSKFDVFFQNMEKVFASGFSAKLQEGLATALGTLNDNITNAFTESIDNFTTAVNNLTTQVTELSTVQAGYDEKIKKLSDVSDKLSGLLTDVETAVDKLKKPLESLATLSEQSQVTVDALNSAKTAVDGLKSVGTDVKTAFNEVVKTSNEKLQEAGNLMVGIVNALHENFESASEEMKNVATSMKDTASGMKATAAEVKTIAPAIKKYVDESIDKKKGK